MKKLLVIFALIVGLSSAAFAVTGELMDTDIRIAYTTPGFSNLKWLNISINGTLATRIPIGDVLPGSTITSVFPVPPKMFPPYKVSIIFEDAQGKDVFVDSVVITK